LSKNDTNRDSSCTCIGCYLSVSSACLFCLSVRLSVSSACLFCLSVRMSVSSVSPSVYLVCLPVLSISPSVCLVCLPVLSISPYVCFVCQSVCLFRLSVRFFHLSVFPPFHLFVRLFFSVSTICLLNISVNVFFSFSLFNLSDNILYNIFSLGNLANGKEHWLQIYLPLSHFDRLVIRLKITILVSSLFIF